MYHSDNHDACASSPSIDVILIYKKGCASLAITSRGRSYMLSLLSYEIGKDTLSFRKLNNNAEIDLKVSQVG